jgi:hypothetical protein
MLGTEPVGAPEAALAATVSLGRGLGVAPLAAEGEGPSVRRLPA